MTRDVDPRNCSFWRTPGGALECACGKSRTAPTEKEKDMEAAELSPEEAIMVAAFGLDKPEYEYGWYDDDPTGAHAHDREWKPKPQTNPTIYWYVFGFLTHPTAESAEHTARKSTWGQPVIVRRVKGETAWEVVS